MAPGAIAVLALIAALQSGQAEVEGVSVESSHRNPRINSQVSEFVSFIAMPIQHESMARWSVHVCIFAAGLLPNEGDFVRRRIADVVTEAGIPVEPAGCPVNFVVVVVDFRKIEGLTWEQVADYVAMVGLAQLRADAETGAAPTILNLFADGGGEWAKALTVWDQAFLKSVYASREGSVTELAQIKLKMTEDLATR